MIRILVYGMTDNLGGIETFMLSYVSNFNKDSLRLDFISPYERIAIEDQVKNTGGIVEHLPNKKKHFIKYQIEIRRFMKANARKYDAVWLNDCMFGNLDILKLGKKYGIPVRIIHAHNSQAMGSKSRLIRHSINKNFIECYANYFFACSDIAAQWSFPKNIVKQHKYKVITNAIDTKIYKYDILTREKYRKKYNVDDRVVLANVGRLHFQKNQTFVLDIFNEYSKIDETAVLWLIGDGEDKNMLVQKAIDLGIDKKVVFFGARQDVPALLQAMDAFIMPSVFEGLGIASIESQASGLPTFMSDVVPTETRVSNQAYYISLSESAKTWAEFIYKIISNYERVDLSREVSSNGFDIERASEELENDFIKMCSSD